MKWQNPSEKVNSSFQFFTKFRTETDEHPIKSTDFPLVPMRSKVPFVEASIEQTLSEKTNQVCINRSS